MDKLAFVKVAEVSGVIASLAENEIVKIASAEDFDAIVDAVAEDLPTQYGMDDVLAKTAEVMEYLYDNGYGEGLEKDAGEVDEQEALAYIGQLTLAKEAGEISEVDFAKEANRVVDALRAAGVRAGAAGKDFVGGLSGKKLRQTLKGNKAFNEMFTAKKKNLDDTLSGVFGKGKSKVKAEYAKGRVADIIKGLKGAGVSKGSLKPGVKQIAKTYGTVGLAGGGIYGANKLRKRKQ
ncbi:MAG: hypothetical protein LHW56_01490 [Candidatus Cloacimonetes bacterium]|nr:hypothetical protein [Candidatus Cloacimonadota bacterium]MDY0171560.1 hypothetical protein [Candidatus Cloacimonadaceae bacterium]